MKARKKSRGRIGKKLGIFCFGIAMLINIMGIGYADYDNSITSSTLVSTGSINPCISDCGIVYQGPGGSIRSLGIDESGSAMNISIDDAEPGYMAIVKYTVRNDGTIPVYCRANCTKGAVEICTPQYFQGIPGGGGTGTGIIQIYVNKRAGTRYSQSVKLSFSQYNSMADNLSIY